MDAGGRSDGGEGLMSEALAWWAPFVVMALGLAVMGWLRLRRPSPHPVVEGVPSRYTHRRLGTGELTYDDVAAIVEGFQYDNGLPPDGLPGPNTVERAREVRKARRQPGRNARRERLRQRRRKDVKIGSIVERPECHVCGDRATWLLEGENEDVDFQSPEEAYRAGWRVVAAFVGTRQGILVFHCPKPECADSFVSFRPTAKLSQHGRMFECEAYTGPSHWWSRGKSKPAGDSP